MIFLTNFFTMTNPVDISILVIFFRVIRLMKWNEKEVIATNCLL